MGGRLCRPLATGCKTVFAGSAPRNHECPPQEVFRVNSITSGVYIFAEI
jgi:hypothetical protein